MALPLYPTFLKREAYSIGYRRFPWSCGYFHLAIFGLLLRSWRHYDCFWRWREKKPGLDFCIYLYNKRRWNVSFYPSMWLLDPGDWSWQKKNCFIHNNQIKSSLMSNLQTIQYIISIFIFIKFYSVIHCKTFPSYFFS